jgi:hypothetical protein
VSKSNRQHGGVVNSAISPGAQEPQQTGNPNDGSVPSNQTCSNHYYKHWWSYFTNDIGMFCLTAATLFVLGSYTWFTKILVTDTEASYTAVQRAFVSPEQPIKVDASGSGDDKIWTFTTNIRNDGATPTKNLIFYQATPCVPHNGTLMALHHSGPNYACNFNTKNGQLTPPAPSDPNDVLRQPKKFNIQTYPLAPHGLITVDSVSVLETDIVKMANDGHPLFI